LDEGAGFDLKSKFTVLSISLDEGAVFDILSIYETKMLYAETEEKRGISREAFYKLANEIAAALGRQKYERIYASVEYERLKIANKRVFDFVEDARHNIEGLAKETDDANLARHFCKGALQKKFFNSEQVEIKTNV
jgi:hypothetical protein